MTARILRLEIKAGDTTCFSEDKWCPFTQTKGFGQRYFCQLFRTDQDLRDQDGVPSGPGSLQRWPECLAAEVAETEGEGGSGGACDEKG